MYGLVLMELKKLLILALIFHMKQLVQAMQKRGYLGALMMSMMRL